MKGYIAVLAAALTVFGAGAYAAEGDYVVVLKNPPASLMNTDDVSAPYTNVFVVGSYMDALNFAPASEIDCIFPDGLAYLFDDEELAAPVNDPRYFDQWHLEHVNASYAWGRGYTGKGVKTGFADSGMKKPSHSDLPVPNSFYNVLTGKDYTDYSDTYGHGTKVAGIIGAIGNNSVGICGMAYNTELVPVKVTEGKSLYTSDLLSGITTAVNYGCSVVNVSAGFTVATSSQATVSSFGKIINDLADKGAIVVAAAGNAGTSEYQYPASYDSVVSVVSCGRAKLSDDAGKGYTEGKIMDLKADGSGYTYRTFLPDEPSTFSQHNNKVTVSAPGYQIFSTSYTGGYTRSDGTSFASPVVAGAAAVAKQIKPDLTVWEFIDALARTSRDVYTEGYDEYTGYGILDMRALTDFLAGTAPDPTDTPEPDDTPAPVFTAVPDETQAPAFTEVPDETQAPTEAPTDTPEPTAAPRTSVVYNGKYSVTAVYPPAPTNTTKVYFAFYRDNRLTAIQSIGVAADSTQTRITYPSAWSSNVPDDLDHIEIFVWGTDMRPVYYKQLIDRSEWQTENN